MAEYEMGLVTAIPADCHIWRYVVHYRVITPEPNWRMRWTLRP